MVLRNIGLSSSRVVVARPRVARRAGASRDELGAGRGGLVEALKGVSAAQADT